VNEFTQVVADCRMAHALLALHNDRKGVGGANAQFRRSLYVVADVAAGEVLNAANVPFCSAWKQVWRQRLWMRFWSQTAARALTRGEPLSGR
jgi:N-acetylneuraminate synthase